MMGSNKVLHTSTLFVILGSLDVALWFIIMPPIPEPYFQVTTLKFFNIFTQQSILIFITHQLKSENLFMFIISILHFYFQKEMKSKSLIRLVSKKIFTEKKSLSSLINQSASKSSQFVCNSNTIKFNFSTLSQKK